MAARPRGNFLTQFRDKRTKEFKNVTADQFQLIWRNYDSDGKFLTRFRSPDPKLQSVDLQNILTNWYKTHQILWALTYFSFKALNDWVRKKGLIFNRGKHVKILSQSMIKLVINLNYMCHRQKARPKVCSTPVNSMEPTNRLIL